MESGMAAHSDDVSFIRLHSHTTYHGKVRLVHRGTDRMDAVGTTLMPVTPSQDEGCIYRTLVPAAVQKDFCFVEWDSTDITHLLGHFD